MADQSHKDDLRSGFFRLIHLIRGQREAGQRRTFNNGVLSTNFGPPAYARRF